MAYSRNVNALTLCRALNTHNKRVTYAFHVITKKRGILAIGLFVRVVIALVGQANAYSSQGQDTTSQNVRTQLATRERQVSPSEVGRIAPLRTITQVSVHVPSNLCC